MTGPPTIAVLLVELARRGIELRAAGDRLRYRPVSAVPPDLAHRLSARRGELLAILAAADVGPVTYTQEELRLLAGLPQRALRLVDSAKAIFGASVIGAATETPADSGAEGGNGGQGGRGSGTSASPSLFSSKGPAPPGGGPQ